MKNGLESAYELVLEKNKEGTVKSDLKPGASAVGDVKKGFGGPEKTSVKKPEEAEKKINPGHGKIKTEGSKMSDLKSMLPESNFDRIFKAQIVMEEIGLEGDESPLEMDGEGGFDEESGDFPPKGDEELGEEVDVATELRMIIDRLTEVAEKLGAYDKETEEISDDLGEGGLEDEESDNPFPEAVQSQLKPFINTVSKMQQKNNKVQSNFNASGKKASTTGGPGKGAADGKLNNAKKTTFGPKMSQKADGKGPMNKVGASIFDNV